MMATTKEQAEQLDKDELKLEKKLIKDLQKEYSLSLIVVRKSIADIYAKYSDNEGKLTYEEMQKYDRLKKIEEEIQAEQVKLYNNTSKLTKDNFNEMYRESYQQTITALETGARVDLRFDVVPIEQIKAQQQNPISGLTLNERLSKNRSDVIIKTREQLVQGLVRGDSIRDMAKRIADVYEGDLNKAVRVARTETNRARNAGTQASYDKAQDMGIEFTKIWLATKDSRTRDAHKSLDNKEADKDGYFYVGGRKAQYPGGFGVASLDVNCRCATYVDIKV